MSQLPPIRVNKSANSAPRIDLSAPASLLPATIGSAIMSHSTVPSEVRRRVQGIANELQVGGDGDAAASAGMNVHDALLVAPHVRAGLPGQLTELATRQNLFARLIDGDAPLQQLCMAGRGSHWAMRAANVDLCGTSRASGGGAAQSGRCRSGNQAVGGGGAGGSGLSSSQGTGSASSPSCAVHALGGVGVQSAHFGASGVNPMTIASLRRGSSALQDPSEVFRQMNSVVMQTLRYVDTVADVDFDLAEVREYDGTRMESQDRLFLSVCCSVFANFAFCNTRDVDLVKLVHFLSDILHYYSANNAYHNALHAADSLQLVSLFFREPAVQVLFTDDEIFCALLGILALDVAHPGMHNSSLAELDHPLVSIYGDTAPIEHASLLVFLHELLKEEHYCFCTTSQRGSIDRDVLPRRELLYEIVVGSAQRGRRALLTRLAEMQEARCVRHEDVPALLTTLVVLASNNFALRPRAQCVKVGARFLQELNSEIDELARRQLPCIWGELRGQEPTAVLADYCASVVKRLADMVRTLVPGDLYDNIERNSDRVASVEEDRVQRVQLTVPPVTEPQWASSAAAVVEVLKKVVAHADSLDRKASKYAILNASPMRAGGGNGGTPTLLSPDGRTAGSGSHFAASPQPSSSFTSAPTSPGLPSMGGASANLLSMPLPAPESMGDSRRSSPTHPHLPSSAEHYFSFLRLYDKCEREGQSARTFCGQLVFLALQLDPAYIARYARDQYGANCSAAECRDMAATILSTEEAPSTAESIANRHLMSGADDVAHTDGFVLYLMEMYCKRECATSQNAAELSDHGAPASTDAPAAMLSAFELGRSTDSPSTRAPSETSNSPIVDEPRMPPQRNSPIRLPIDTDSSSKILNGLDRVGRDKDR